MLCEGGGGGGGAGGGRYCGSGKEVEEEMHYQLFAGCKGVGEGGDIVGRVRRWHYQLFAGWGRGETLWVG